MCCITMCPDDGNYYYESGECKQCKPYFVPNADEDGCEKAPECKNPRDYMEEMGDCLTCPEYTYPNANKTACIHDTCDYDTAW